MSGWWSGCGQAGGQKGQPGGQPGQKGQAGGQKCQAGGQVVVRLVVRLWSGWWSERSAWWSERSGWWSERSGWWSGWWSERSGWWSGCGQAGGQKGQAAGQACGRWVDLVLALHDAVMIVGVGWGLGGESLKWLLWEAVGSHWCVRSDVLQCLTLFYSVLFYLHTLTIVTLKCLLVILTVVACALVCWWFRQLWPVHWSAGDSDSCGLCTGLLVILTVVACALVCWWFRQLWPVHWSAGDSDSRGQCASLLVIPTFMASARWWFWQSWPARQPAGDSDSCGQCASMLVIPTVVACMPACWWFWQLWPVCQPAGDSDNCGLCASLLVILTIVACVPACWWFWQLWPVCQPAGDSDNCGLCARLLVILTIVACVPACWWFWQLWPVCQPAGDSDNCGLCASLLSSGWWVVGGWICCSLNAVAATFCATVPVAGSEGDWLSAAGLHAHPGKCHPFGSAGDSAKRAGKDWPFPRPRAQQVAGQSWWACRPLYVSCFLSWLLLLLQLLLSLVLVCDPASSAVNVNVWWAVQSACMDGVWSVWTGI